MPEEPRTYRHPDMPDSTVPHPPIWRWRFAEHTVEAARARSGQKRNDWQYIDRMPTHDGFVGIHPDVEAQQVTARMLRDALDDARLQGELEALFPARRGPERRKAKRRINQHRARRRTNARRRA